MKSSATTVDEYLKSLPEDRREPITQLYALMKKKLPKGFTESMQYGMISFGVPHSLYPPGYHCSPKDPLPFASLASQKNHMALYLTWYGSPEPAKWMADQFKAKGKKLDAGKSCIKFKKLDDLPLDVVGEVLSKVSVAEFIKMYEAAFPPKK